MNIDPRFTNESGPETFTGSELLVKGTLEVDGGVHLLTGYPGSPVAGFFDTCKNIAPLLNEHGVVAKIANNEALAVAMANGSQMAACRAIVTMKNVGLHVASDALALGVLAGPRDDGGVIVVCGDDPWSDSTQVPADSRFLAEHMRMPMVEPSTPQEIKDWISLSFQLCKAAHVYVGYMMTTALADGGGSVEVKPNHFPEINSDQRVTLSYSRDIEPNLDQSVLLPPRSWIQELGMPQRHAAACAKARQLGINRIDNKPQKGQTVPLGFVAAGHAHAYLVHALEEMGFSDRIPILKLGLTYPVDENIVTEFARFCEQIIVVEERRSFVEQQIKEILVPKIQTDELNTEIWGKQFPRDLPGIPATRGLHPSLLIQLLVPLIRDHQTLPVAMTNGRLSAELDRINKTNSADINIPIRTATFCPGCPHRDSASVLLDLRLKLLDPKYMQREHKSPPIDLVCHGDAGCYTMLMFEPNKPLMHNYSGMGLGGGTGAGIDPFITNKQIVFMGDGTFFQSGQLAITQSISNKQDITYIILDNATIAMTGHQNNPGQNTDLTGNPITPLEIERIVKGMVPKTMTKHVRIARMDPSDRQAYSKLLETTILEDGVKVIIADKECAITYYRRERQKQRQIVKKFGYLPKQVFMNISTEACDYCLECTNQTGCPGLKIIDSDYGPKIQTDLSWCVNDGACHRINACPAFEEVTITRKQPHRSGDKFVDLDNIPQPPRPIHADQDVWRCYIAGVGGMGIGVTTSIIVTAGTQMGYQVQFLDRKGLAQRNGGVFSQIVFTRDNKRDVNTPNIPYGKADLLIGIDLLEAVRAIDPKFQSRVASSDKTVAVVNTAKTETILSLMNRDSFTVHDLETVLRRSCRADHYLGFNIGDLCERVLDNKLYGNIMMLGIAYQKGYIPLTLDVIEQAIRKLLPVEQDRNLRAFHIGRKIVERPDLFIVESRHEFESARQALRRKTNMIRSQFRAKRAKLISRQFRVLMKQTFHAVRGRFVDDQLMRDVVIRAYDCLIWAGIDYAKQYCNRIVEIFIKDDAKYNFAVTRAVIHNLARVMLIKDEIYVAAMLTNPEKYKRDMRRFKVNLSRGDRISYRHHNRPEFSLFNRNIRFTWKSRDWQLAIVSRLRFLRNLLPGWHKRERDFRDWYIALVDQAAWSSDAEYRNWQAILETPQSVTGYRDVRYPLMDAAKAAVEQLLANKPDQPTKPRLDVTITLPVNVPTNTPTKQH